MAEVGAMMASAVGKQIASKLGELLKEEMSLLWGYRDDVEGMRAKMEDLVAVMHDADDRMRRGERDGKAVGRWLAKFKSVAFDVEDVLDELDANELISKTESKVKLLFSWNNELLQRSTMAHNMKTVRGEIDEIVKEGQALNLARHEARPEGSQNKETFAASRNVGTKSGIVGRDVEKEKIISLLLKTEAKEDISIIPVIGLGGIGKSTLAESVLADQRVNVFDVKVWVYVSEQFSLHNIGNAIMKSINSSISLDNCTLQFLHDNLQKVLSTTRYLIVLDDLWEEDGERLEELKRMLQYGCKGSKIVVTTRNKSVVQNLSNGFLANNRKICPVSEPDQINLGVLSPGDCWEVMKQRALGPNDDQSGLQKIGMEIAAKCGGIPLVANALGQVMFERRTITAWEDIRDITFDLGLREVHQNKALERLMLSYYYMKMEFKMCFTYLAAFRKGFVVDGRRLIQQWIALGYIHGDDDGEMCINYLLGMSFLQISRSSSVSLVRVYAKAPSELTMHDLVHDLASVIIADELLLLDANGTKPRTWNSTSFCRHAHLINYQNQPKVLEDLPNKVRSLHFSDLGKLQLPQMTFSGSKYLRILDLNACSAGGNSIPSNLDPVGYSVDGQSTSRNIVLPSSLHHTKLLRYLDATALPIRSLPNSFHTLQHMQTLILSQCSIETLPDNICSLHKLCHLDLSSNISLIELPMSLGKLSKLSFLNLLGCSILKELPESICEITCLRHLDMSACCALQKLPDKFGSLPKLLFLNLSGCSKLTKLPDSIRFRSLEHLDLSNCHVLENLPKDFGNLQNLGFLNLSGCYKVSVLPESFCQLIHLNFFDLSDCHDLTELPKSFGNLLELEFLVLASCCKLKLLPGSFCQLSKLRYLNLSYCMRLENLPSSLGELNLELLDISATHFLELPDSIRNITTLNRLVSSLTKIEVFDKACDIKKQLNFSGMIIHEVHQIENKGCSSIVELAQLTCHELTIVGLENVMNPMDAERTKLRDKSDLRSLHLAWRYQPDLHSLHLAWGVQCEEDKFLLERLIPPRNLEEFHIYNYMSYDFPNWMSDLSSYLPSLTFIMLSGLGKCDNLPPFGKLPNLRSLVLQNIPHLRKVGREFYGEGGGTCRKLRYIQVEAMENSLEWWTTLSGVENEESLIPNLHSLEIKDCPMLNFIPYPPRSMFWILDNSSMVLPEGGFGKVSSSALPFQMVVRNCNFSPDKWDRLQHLSTLEIFQVVSCDGVRFLEVIGCLTSLRTIYIHSLKDLEVLPELLGNLTSLENFYVDDCPLLASLPESMKNLTALRDLRLMECKGLEVLPEGLGQLVSLQELYIVSCPNLTSLPASMKNLTALRQFHLEKYKGLEVLPEGLGQLVSLQELYIFGCPNLTFLPASMKNLAALKLLGLKECNGLEVLPEGLGQLISLQAFLILDCPNLTRLPGSIRNLSKLEELYISGCPSLVERCQGEDAYLISHIPNVTLHRPVKHHKTSSWLGFLRMGF